MGITNFGWRAAAAGLKPLALPFLQVLVFGIFDRNVYATTEQFLT